MALLYIDGFDSYATADVTKRGWTLAGNYSAIEASGRFGSRLRLSGGSGSQAWASRTVAASGSTCIIGVAFNPLTFYASRPYIFAVLSSGTEQFALGYNSSYQLVVYRGNYATALGTSARSIWANSWAYIELKVLISNTVGTYELRVNGDVWSSGTGLDTQGATDANWTTVRLDGPWDPSTPADAFDDLYVCDGSGGLNDDFLGDLRVDAHFPTSDGATHTFTPSTGSDHYALVDDATPNDDTDYNSTTVTGNKDTLGYEDLKNAGGTIIGVQVALVAKKGDAGTCTLCPVVRHSGTDNEGTAVGLSTSYLGVVQMYQQNPNGGSPIDWDETDFNAAEFGYKKVV
jgi:hypothetical protein